MKALALVTALSLAPCWGAAAQVAVRVAFGARHTTTLVRDSIVTPFDVRPAIAPNIAIGFELPEHRGWAPGVMLDASWSALRRHESAGAADLGSLTTFAFTVALRRSLAAGLSATARVGGLQYLPGREAGVFRDGPGTPFPIAGLDLRYASPALRRFAVELRYDLHRFITSALQDSGFTGGRPVHRLAFVLAADISNLR
jgi:hypothetical protein